jgi:hypothetical protein
MDQNLKDLIESVQFIKERMATKDDLTELATKSEIAELRLELHTFRVENEASFRSLHIELADINRRLDALTENYANLKGVTKEIDDLRAQLRAIQKHLGLSRQTAA